MSVGTSWHLGLNVISLGLAASFFWGASDFLGGLATRRANVVGVVAVAHSLSLFLLLLIAFGTHSPLPPERFAVLGLCAGGFGGIALMLYYQALSMGEMGLTTALTGLLTAMVPVVFSFFTEGSPRTSQIAGFVLAAGAIALIAYAPAKDLDVASAIPLKLTKGLNGPPNLGGWLRFSPSGVGHRPVALGLATLSGLGFGVFLVVLKIGSAHGVLWQLIFSRVASVALTVVILIWTMVRAGHSKRAKTLDKRSWPYLFFWIAGGAGVLEGTGSLLYMGAASQGRLDVAAVLASLYPAVTIVLAAWFLKERTTPSQALGMALALGAVVLVSL
jgi:drug/metabolite transporter (DMT)-like permease